MDDLTREQKLHAACSNYVQPDITPQAKKLAARGIFALVERAICKAAERRAAKLADPAVQAEDLVQIGATRVMTYLDQVKARGEGLHEARQLYVTVTQLARSTFERPAAGAVTTLERRVAEDEFLRQRGDSMGDAFSQLSRLNRENFLHDRVLPGLRISARQREALLLTYETRPGETELRGYTDLSRVMGVSPPAARVLHDKAVEKVKRVTRLRGLKPDDAV